MILRHRRNLPYLTALLVTFGIAVTFAGGYEAGQGNPITYTRHITRPRISASASLAQVLANTSGKAYAHGAADGAAGVPVCGVDERCEGVRLGGPGVHEVIAVHVNGGTGAGVKRPLKERRWVHDCKREWNMAENMPGGWVIHNRELSAYSCPSCGARRPTTSEET